MTRLSALLARLAWLPIAALAGCGLATSAPGVPGKPAPSLVAAAKLPALAWADLTPETFARAKAERRFVVLDGAAEWCHFCHVMEAMTYRNPEVAKLLAERFIAVKVDVDARPDIEERYGEYGWPATVIFSPDGEELGKYRGYIPPEPFLQMLRDVVARPPPSASAASARAERGTGAPLSEAHLAWVARMTELELDDYWDEAEGGWGRRQKAPLGWNNAYALARARAGDEKARARALVALDKQRALLDPVWGGIYQYSAASHWRAPHFEKLMTYQAGALDNYAAAYALTRDARWLDAARSVRAYVDRFLTSKEGGFFATQDADLSATVDGHTYYALGEAGRLALGVPRIDTHEYARDNGLAIAAYATLYEATKDASALATATRAEGRIASTHATPGGGVTHGEAGREEGAAAKRLYLSDNAAFGFGVMRLYEVAREPAHLELATRLGRFLLSELADAQGGAFFAATIDPAAAGVFAARRKPFEENIMAVRFLAKLGRATGDPSLADACRAAVAGALRELVTPENIKARGRMLGDLLLALEETRGAR